MTTTPPPSMIEKMARALYEFDSPGSFDGGSDIGKEHFRSLARAALQAMLEPSEGMVWAGVGVNWDAMNAMELAWQAMISAALEGK